MTAEAPRVRLTEAAHFTLEVRNSKFLAQACYLPDIEQARDLLTQLSEPAASHNCWAWRYGEQYRFSDDGEPGGTAGRPILAAIDNQGFDQCLLVVTRWYGGIQLGTGGLARAYGGCATRCLQQARSEPLVAREQVQALCPYPVLASFKALLSEADACIMQEDYQTFDVRLVLAVPAAKLECVRQQLLNLSRGDGQLIPLD